MIVLALILFLVVIAVLLRTHFARNYKLMQQFDGPPQDPIIGNLRQVQFRDLHDLYNTLRGWEAKYRSLWALKYVSQYSIFIEKAEHMEAVLKHSVNIDKSRDYQFFEPWLGKGLLMSSGAKWHQRRKLLTPAFHFQILKDFIPVFNEQAQVFVDILREKSKHGYPVDLAPLLCSLTLDVICETAMGTQLNSQRQRSPIAEALTEFGDIAIYRSFRPWLWPDWIFSRVPIGQKSDKAVQVLHSFTNCLIREREDIFKTSLAIGENQVQEENTFKKKQRMAFLDLLLKLKSEGGIDLDGVREEVDTFMFAGHDTTAKGLMWAFYLIAAHPEVQTRLHEDVDALFDTLTETDFVRGDALNDMPYLDCVLKESQRMFPSVPIIARTITKSFEVDGYKIPEGIMANLSILGLHRNPEHYLDPDTFDPTRFEPENAAKRHPFAFVPFSAGPRNCIGQKFAVLEEKIIICHVIRRFRLEAIEPMSSMKPSMQLVLKPLNGVWLRLTPRTEIQ